MFEESVSNQLKTKKNRPVCLRNLTYSSALEIVQRTLSRYSNLPLQVLLVGSGHRKRNPPDADILVVRNELNSKVTSLTTTEIMEFLKKNIVNFKKLSNNNFSPQEADFFYHSLPEASLLRVLADLCCTGASIKEAYQKNKRSIIKISIGDAILELNLEYPSFQAHAAVSDFTINTLYYDIKTASYTFAHEHAFNDIRQKILRATHEDIHSMFKEDITVFFRALRIIGSEKYTAEAKLLKVIQDLPNTLPTAINAMNPDRLTLDKYILLCSGYAIHVLNFIEDNELFDYLFPIASPESNQDKKIKHFLFRKIAEASDALFLNDASHEYYPHAIAEYMESIENLTLDDKRKIMLCFFDYAIHHVEFIEKNIASNKYTIYHHKNSMGFYAMQRHIDSIIAIGKNLISHYLAAYQDTAEKNQAIRNTNDNSSRAALSNESQGTYTDEETIEGYLSKSDNDTKEKTDSLSENLTSPEESDNEDLTGVNSNEKMPNSNNNDTQEASKQSENVPDEEKNKKSIKNQKKNAKKNQRKKAEKEHLKLYNSGLENLERYEYEFALNHLTQAAVHQDYQHKLRTKAVEAATKIPLKSPVFSARTCLQAATLFDSIDEKNNAICYYRNFLHYYAEENIVGSSGRSDLIGDYSFVYLRLFILSHSLSQYNTQPPAILMHEELALNTMKTHAENIEKYSNEIILSPIINSTVKSQALAYIKDKRILLHTADHSTVPSSYSDQSTSAGKDYVLGLYYSALLNFRKTFEIFVVQQTAIKSGIKAQLLASILYCCMQLNLYKESVHYLEQINYEDNGSFINDMKNTPIINNIFGEVSKYTCTNNLEDYCEGMELLKRILFLSGEFNPVIQFFKEALKALPESGLTSTQKKNISNRKTFLYFKTSEIYCAITQKTIHRNEDLARSFFKEAEQYYAEYLKSEIIIPITPEQSETLCSRILIIREILQSKKEVAMMQNMMAPLSKCHAAHFSEKIKLQDTQTFTPAPQAASK